MFAWSQMTGPTSGIWPTRMPRRASAAAIRNSRGSCSWCTATRTLDSQARPHLWQRPLSSNELAESGRIGGCLRIDQSKSVERGPSSCVVGTWRSNRAPDVGQWVARDRFDRITGLRHRVHGPTMDVRRIGGRIKTLKCGAPSAVAWLMPGNYRALRGSRLLLSGPSPTSHRRRPRSNRPAGTRLDRSPQPDQLAIGLSDKGHFGAVLWCPQGRSSRPKRS